MVSSEDENDIHLQLDRRRSQGHSYKDATNHPGFLMQEATSVRPLSSASTTAAVGRSLGRAARYATSLLGAMTGSVENVIVGRRGKPQTTARSAPVASLLQELAALVHAQPEEAHAALADDPKFWSLIEQLQTARYLGVPEPAPPSAAAVETVEATVVEPAPSKVKRAARPAGGQPEPDAAAPPKSKDSE
jgi:hypothetical protein